MQKTINSNKLKITTLTPVHIGTGDDYTPTNYILDNDYLYYFQDDVINLLPTSKIDELNQKLRGNVDERFIHAYIKILNENKDIIKKNSKYKIPINSGFFAEYEKKIIRTYNNDFFVNRTLINSFNYNSIIPGSSINGAVRTAIVESWSKGKTERCEKISEKFMKFFLETDQKPETNIMKYIKFEDVVMGGTETRKIYYAINCKKKVDQSKLKNPRVTTRIETIDYENTGIFNINLLNTNINHNSPVPTINEIAEFCNDRYLDMFKDHLISMYRDEKTLNFSHYNRLVRCYNLISDNYETKFILRLGKYSGAEAMTLPGRNIKINRGKKLNPTYEDSSTTHWLVSDKENVNNDMLPFGWILCELI